MTVDDRTIAKALAAMRHLGTEVWKQTRRLSDDDALEVVSGLVPEDAGATPEVTRSQLMVFGRWIDGAARSLQTDPRYFAAMCASSASADALVELRVPWPTFLLEVPAECVRVGGEDVRLALFSQLRLNGRPYVLVVTFGGGEFGDYMSAIAGTSATMCFWLPDVTLADALLGPFQKAWFESDEHRRSFEVLFRGVVGLLYTIQHTRNWSERGSSGTRTRLRSDPPPHRTIVVGRPLSLDVRASLMEYQGGERGGAAPSVQTLVRGHIKRQVMGPGGSARKLVWIEPYWRGPENAPILVRPYQVGTKKND